MGPKYKKQTLHEFIKENLSITRLRFTTTQVDNWSFKELCEFFDNNQDKRLTIDDALYIKVPVFKQIAEPNNKTVLIIDDPNIEFN